MSTEQLNFIETSYGAKDSHAALDLYENEIVSAATPLLILIPLLRHTTHFAELDETRNKLLAEIEQFQLRLSQLALFSKQTLFNLQYCLCTALDEAVLINSDESTLPWKQNSLLNHFHQETWGGERFYTLLDGMLKDPEQNRPILEYFYMLLSLGFKGKYYDDHLTLLSIQNDLFEKINQKQTKKTFPLSPHWQRYVEPWRYYKVAPLWSTIAIAAGIVFIVGIGANYLAMKKIHPVISQLNDKPNIVTSE